MERPKYLEHKFAPGITDPDEFINRVQQHDLFIAGAHMTIKGEEEIKSRQRYVTNKLGLRAYRSPLSRLFREEREELLVEQAVLEVLHLESKLNLS